MSRRVVALALALPCACAFACGAGEPPRSPAVPPVTTSPPPAVPALVFETKADERRDASFTDWSVADAAVRPPPVRAVAVPSYGAAESPKPGETHPFRLVAR